MAVHQFQDDDEGYLNCIAANPSGYVINIQRRLNPSDAKLHQAVCRTIKGENPRRGPWTGPYIKICSTDLGQLDSWAMRNVGAPIRRWRTCTPPG